MKLSAEQFESILASLRSFPQDRSAEKRRAPRVGLRGEATVIPCGRQANTGNRARQQLMKVRDLSTEGIGLAHTEPVEANTYVIVTFRRSLGDLLSVLYRVVHCRRLSERSYSIGARLERVIDMDRSKSGPENGTAHGTTGNAQVA